MTASSVKICISLTRYAEENEILWQTLESLAAQQDITTDVLVLDQQDDAATREKCAELSSAAINFQYDVIPAKSLSFARNEAIRRSPSEIILYIDADALAAPDWASKLAGPLLKGEAAIAGSRILPRWLAAPSFLVRSRLVREQYSLLDLGPETQARGKIVGAGFGLNRASLGDEAYFDEQLGRRNGKLFGGEEVDLCRRAIAGGSAVVYVGEAVIDHQILPERTRVGWIFRRMYYTGLGRGARGGTPDPTHGGYTAWDLAIMPLILGPYALGVLRALVARRSRDG